MTLLHVKETPTPNGTDHSSFSIGLRGSKNIVRQQNKMDGICSEIVAGLPVSVMELKVTARVTKLVCCCGTNSIEALIDFFVTFYLY